MKAVVLNGHGGLDKLEWREDVPVPQPNAGEVLIRVGASSVNNTDVNPRTGWYSRSVRGDTNSAAMDGYGGASDADGAWSEALSFCQPHELRAAQEAFLEKSHLGKLAIEIAG